MASYSDSSILSSDEFPNTSLSMTSSIDHQRSTSDELSSKPKQPNEVIGGSKNAPENDEMDELIQKRIKKIYKRLKETDQNIKTMETLLGRKNNWRQHEEPYTSEKVNVRPIHIPIQSAQKGRSDGTQSSLDVHDVVKINMNEQELVRSLEDLQTVDKSKSPMSEQLRRLTQSMQDLHNYQQRVQKERHENDSTASKMKPINQQDTKAVSRETLENPKILQHDLNRNENTYDYVCQIGSLVVAFQQNMSEMKSQQLKLASTIEVLTKQVERHHCLSQSSFAKEYPNQNELQDFQENMHYEIQETTKASKEISLHVERVLDELQKLKHITSQASSRSSHKKSKRAIQKLKIQGETLLLEKKHFEDTSHILEEKCRSLAMEKELLLHQLDECQNKLGAILKDEQATKTKLVEEQIQNVKKDSTLEYIRMVHEETKKKVSSYEDEIDKLKRTNEKYVHENECLTRQNQDLKSEVILHQQKLRESIHSPEQHENLLSNLHDYKLQVSMLEIQKNDLSKKFNEQVETNKKLQEVISETKANTNVEITDHIKRKETEMNSVIALLKEQLADYQAHIKLLQQENKNFSEKNSCLSSDIMRIQAEVREMHRKQGSLLKNVYSKEEELKLKTHQLDNLEENINELRTVCRKMEQEYKAILISINAEVDRTLQLWIQTSSYTPQALSQGTRTTCHPKIHLVDIISKLKWMQDDLRSQLNQQKITNKQEVGNIGSRYLVRDSDISNPENGNFKTTTSELNIFGNSETGSENVGKPDLSEDRKVHTTRLNCNLKQTWEGAQMSKNHPVDFFENFASFSGKNSKVVNNHKRMNSTEIVNGDVQANNNQHASFKSNTGSNRAKISSPFLSSISEPSSTSDEEP